MNLELIKLILENYNIKCDISSINIEILDQYPHIFIMKIKNQKLIVKVIDNLNNIEKIFPCLENNNYVSLPLKNIFGDYSFIHNKKNIFVYKELENIEKLPSAIWWANCLNSLHCTPIKQDFTLRTNINLERDSLLLLEKASIYFDLEIKKKIELLLNSTYKNKIIASDSNLVICHNDPYNSNVLIDDLEYKLIDLDGVGLGFKEFDIQRLFYNIVNTYEDINLALDFFNEFIMKYNNKIDFNLLKKIYIYDFLRSFSWLSIVSNDIKRLDRNRQMKELELYKNSLLEEKHIKVLKKL